jgi:hypothetical protein
MRALVVAVLALPVVTGCPALQSDWTVSGSVAVDGSVDATAPKAPGASSGSASGGSSAGGSSGASGGATGSGGLASGGSSGSSAGGSSGMSGGSGGAGGSPACGNGVIDFGEACDSANLGGTTCATVTFGLRPGGVLRCTVQCTFDTSSCVGAGTGGNTGSGGSVG